MSTVRDRDLRLWLLDRRERLKAAIERFKENAQINHLLKEVDSALERVDNGTYGLCEVCHEPIEEEALITDPLIRVCLGHLTPAQQQSLEQDLSQAAKIQAKLLPGKNVSIPGWDIYYHYEAAGPVSGDYCDLVELGPGNDSLFFVLGDVSGKGVAASMLMANLHAIFHSLVSVGLSITEMMERANRLFCESTMSTDYATLVCGKISQSGEVEICNAGHFPPLLVRKNEISNLGPTGLPLGMFCSGDYTLNKLRLSVGDTLLLYTDGLTEARNKADSEYGEKRLVDLVKSFPGSSARMLTEACLKDQRSFLSGAPKTDDLTIMTIRRAP
ncbi:MAG TPA: SpoIIE family protein phosphatase [Terriglobales bacterium]|nr:SpoIIE family protein phosphatase [Terriglobales bacterium]